MKNEKNKPQDKDQLRSQQSRGTETEQRTQEQKLKKEQRTSREQDSEFNSELEEGDDVEQGRAGDKFGKQKGRQQDTTKTQQPRLKDEYQGGSGKGIDVD